MSLIYCPNCRDKISEFSTVCPNCKNEVPKNNNEFVDKNPRKNVFSENKKKPKKWLIILLCVLAAPAGLLIGIIGDKMKSNKRKQQIESYENYSNTRSEQSSQNNSEVENTCTICNRTFTGKGYEEVSNGVWRLCEEPYQCYICSKSCGMKHTRQMNNLINETSDGKVYDSNVCSMCKGTGIEKNTSHLTDESGRTCPMCNGKGVQGY